MSLMARDRTGNLDLATSAGNIELLRRPRSQDLDPTNLAPDVVSSDRIAYLDLATSSGNIEAGTLLRRPRSQDTDPTNLAPEVVSSDRNHLGLATSADNIEAGRLLRRPRSQDTDPTNPAPDVVSSDALLTCARGGSWNEVLELLGKAKQTLTQTEFSALLNALDESGRTVLHYAAWLGHQYKLAHLLRCYKDIDVNVSGTEGFTALHLAAWKNHREVVSLLLCHPATNPQIGSTSPLAEIVSSLNDRDNLLSEHRRQRQQGLIGEGIRGPAEESFFLYPELYNTGATALHWAVWAGHVGSVKVFLQQLSIETRLKVLNAVDDHLMTPLHYAVIRGDASIVEALLTTSRVRGNLEEKRKNFTPLDLAYKLIPQAQGRLDVVQEYHLMISMLQERPDVKASIESLCKDRQVFVDAANAILIGAALIAGISFAGWLQPPLGFQQYYDSRYLLTGLAPSGTFESFAAMRQHRSVQVFWIFNNLSFCFAIATMITGAGTVLPSHAIGGRAEVEHIRTLLIRASVMLSVTVYCALGAFIAAGFADLPPTFQYRWGMIATSLVGGFVCLVVLCHYYKRMLRLFRFENFSPGLTEGEQVPLGLKEVLRVLLHDSP